MKTLLLLASLITFSFLSCQNETNPAQNQGCGEGSPIQCSFPKDDALASKTLTDYRSQIQGKWKWIKTRYEDLNGHADTTYEAVYMNIDRYFCFDGKNQLVIFVKDKQDCRLCYNLHQQESKDAFPVQLDVANASSRYCELQIDPGFIKIQNDSLLLTSADKRYTKKWLFRKSN